jgi:hypothetical protein
MLQSMDSGEEILLGNRPNSVEARSNHSVRYSRSRRQEMTVRASNSLRGLLAKNLYKRPRRRKGTFGCDFGCGLCLKVAAPIVQRTSALGLIPVSSSCTLQRNGLVLSLIFSSVQSPLFTPRLIFLSPSDPCTWISTLSIRFGFVWFGFRLVWYGMTISN